MSNLIFISGDFCSGTTLLFTIFRKTGRYYCLYEPLHELLPEYLIFEPRVYEHHFFVDNYFSEYRGFDKMPMLFNPLWGKSRLRIQPEEDDHELYRYLSYLVGTAFGRAEKVVLKFNRVTFRLGWLRARFPQAKIIHIYRDKEAQWHSVVKRGQIYLGREDIGQNDVAFQGFGIARWCDDLKSYFPELHESESKTGYERYSKLWTLSFHEHRRHADMSLDYGDLTHRFDEACAALGKCVNFGFDVKSLRQYVVPPEDQQRVTICSANWRGRIQRFLNKAGRRYARARIQLRYRRLRSMLGG